MTEAVLGIDIAKDKIDVVLLVSGRHRRKTFANSRSGHAHLLQWLRDKGVAVSHACMEATGRYWEALALQLHDAGHRVSVVNPCQVKNFARSKLTRNKTDRVDADLVAEFCLLLKPLCWSPPSTAKRDLRDLVRVRDGLLASLIEYRNRLGEGTLYGPASAALGRIIDALQDELVGIERAISEQTASCPALATEMALLTSIPGIGVITAAGILVETPDMTLFRTAKQVAAYAGLSPRNRQSGSSILGPGRLVRTGNANLRSLLYLPALTALRFNPVIKAFADNLRSKARLAPKQIVAAAMRKLLHLCFGVLKNATPFNPNHSAGQQQHVILSADACTTA
jgi:transposase